MIELFYMEDKLIMEVVFYFMIFFTLLILGFYVTDRKQHKIEYLIFGNVFYILQHAFVLWSIQSNLSLTFYVNMFDILTATFYMMAILQITNAKIHIKEFIIFNIIAMIGLFLIIGFDVLISFTRAFTNGIIFIMVFDTILQLRNNTFKKNLSSFPYTFLNMVFFLLIKLTIVIVRVATAAFENSIDDIQSSIVFFTFMNLIIVVGMNISILFSQYDKLNYNFKKLSTKDYLTNIYNRRFIMEKMEEYLELNRRNKLNFAVVLFDIDKFKNINDSYGHLTGDRVLVEIAEALQKSTRKIDYPARYGGDEFVVIVTLDSEKELGFVVDRLLHRLEEIHAGFDDLKVNISGGATLINENTKFDEVDDILNLADQKLYDAKKLPFSKIIY